MAGRHGPQILIWTILGCEASCYSKSVVLNGALPDVSPTETCRGRVCFEDREKQDGEYKSTGIMIKE